DRVNRAQELPGSENQEHCEEKHRSQDIDEAAGEFDAHRILRASAKKAHNRPRLRNWGTRKNRSLAYEDSTTPRKVASASTLSANAARASPSSADEAPRARPAGKNSAMARLSMMSCLVCVAR